MSLQPNPQQQIEKPVGVIPPSSDPTFFVMPPEYRHGATGKKLAVPQPPAKLPTAPPTPPPTVLKPTIQKRGPSRQVKILLGFGLVLILGLAIAGVVVLRRLEPAEVVPEERPTPSTRPAPPEKQPEPQLEPVPEPVPEPESPFPSATTPGADTDSDGLTDLEETLVYGTDPRRPDTDSDGFLDGNEVFHRYNPNGTAPGTLLESELVRPFTGPALDAAWYRLLYPSDWIQGDLTEDWGTPIVFAAPTGEKIFVTVLQRQEGIAFREWVAELTQADAGSFTAMTTKNGYAALVSENQLTTYVDGSVSSSLGAGYAVKVHYETGIKATIDYLQTFKMMVNSIEWL